MSGELRAGGIDPPHDLGGGVGEQLAGGGEADPSPDALQQLRAGLGFEPGEVVGDRVNLVGRNENLVGDVSGFAPPGDIHRVSNVSETTAISIHIYGTNITRIGSSARRYYD